MVPMDGSGPAGSEVGSMGDAIPHSLRSASPGPGLLLARQGPSTREETGSAHGAATGELHHGLPRSRRLEAGSRDIVMRLDRDGRCLYVSPNARDVTGIDASQFIGKMPRELGLPVALCDYLVDAVARVVTAGAPLEEEFTFDGTPGPRRIRVAASARVRR